MKKLRHRYRLSNLSKVAQPMVEPGFKWRQPATEPLHLATTLCCLLGE